MSQIVFTDNYKVVRKTVTHSTHTTKAIPSVLILFTHLFSNFTIIKIITVFITNLIIADLLKETQKKEKIGGDEYLSKGWVVEGERGHLEIEQKQLDLFFFQHK